MARTLPGAASGCEGRARTLRPPRRRRRRVPQGSPPPPPTTTPCGPAPRRRAARPAPSRPPAAASPWRRPGRWAASCHSGTRRGISRTSCSWAGRPRSAPLKGALGSARRLVVCERPILTFLARQFAHVRPLYLRPPCDLLEIVRWLATPASDLARRSIPR